MDDLVEALRKLDLNSDTTNRSPSNFPEESDCCTDRPASFGSMFTNVGSSHGEEGYSETGRKTQDDVEESSISTGESYYEAAFTPKLEYWPRWDGVNSAFAVYRKIHRNPLIGGSDYDTASTSSASGYHPVPPDEVKSNKDEVPFTSRPDIAVAPKAKSQAQLHKALELQLQAQAQQYQTQELQLKAQVQRPKPARSFLQQLQTHLQQLKAHSQQYQSQEQELQAQAQQPRTQARQPQTHLEAQAQQYQTQELPLQAQVQQTKPAHSFLQQLEAQAQQSQAQEQQIQAQAHQSKPAFPHLQQPQAQQSQTEEQQLQAQAQQPKPALSHLQQLQTQAQQSQAQEQQPKAQAQQLKPAMFWPYLWPVETGSVDSYTLAPERELREGYFSRMQGGPEHSRFLRVLSKKVPPSRLPPRLRPTECRSIFWSSVDEDREYSAFPIAADFPRLPWAEDFRPVRPERRISPRNVGDLFAPPPEWNVRRIMEFGAAGEGELYVEPSYRRVESPNMRGKNDPLPLWLKQRVQTRAEESAHAQKMKGKRRLRRTREQLNPALLRDSSSDAEDYVRPPRPKPK